MVANWETYCFRQLVAITPSLAHLLLTSDILWKFGGLGEHMLVFIFSGELFKFKETSLSGRTLPAFRPWLSFWNQSIHYDSFSLMGLLGLKPSFHCLLILLTLGKFQIPLVFIVCLYKRKILIPTTEIYNENEMRDGYNTFIISSGTQLPLTDTFLFESMLP